MAKQSRSAEAIRSARLRAISLTNAVGGVLSMVIRWAGFCFIAYQLQLAIGHVAGKETAVAFITKIGANITANQWAAYLFGGSGVVYGIAQRRLRKRSVSKMSERLQKLETKVDPKRSSSGLSSQGATPIDY